MQRKVLYFNNFTILPHNHRHTWPLLEASQPFPPLRFYLSRKLFRKLSLVLVVVLLLVLLPLVLWLLQRQVINYRASHWKSRKAGGKRLGWGEFSATFLATCGNC